MSPKSSTRESVGSSSASQRLPVTVHGRYRRGEMAFRDVDLEDVGCGEKATQDKLEREIRDSRIVSDLVNLSEVAERWSRNREWEHDNAGELPRSCW